MRTCNQMCGLKIHLIKLCKPVINNYVLILNIPVQYASGMEEVHSRDHLSEILKDHFTFPGIALVIIRINCIKIT